MTNALDHGWKVGAVIHGFAGGAFGRDSYHCRRVEAVGVDWIVTRKLERDCYETQVEFASGDYIPEASLWSLPQPQCTCDYRRDPP